MKVTNFSLKKNFLQEQWYRDVTIVNLNTHCVDNQNWRGKGDRIKLVDRSDRLAWIQSQIRDLEIIWKV
jgi:hypothetical protein